MKRTTIRLDEHLLAEAKRRAAQGGITLTAFIEEALRERLARSSAPTPSKMEFPVYGEGWVRPGVDIHCNASLLDLMESPDDPA